jgi:plastocyanin
MSWIRQFTSFALLATATGVLASVNHEVTVGKGALLFSPETTVAQPGDTITFHFFPKVINWVAVLMSKTNTSVEPFRNTIFL